MTPEIIIDAFKKQFEAQPDPTKPFQVFYMTTRMRPPGPDPFGHKMLPAELSVSIELAVYDVPALVKKFENHVWISSSGPDESLPKFEPITLLIA